MQNLTLEERKRVEEILISDRQWCRHVRLGHAKRMLKLSYADWPNMVPIWKTVVRRLNYDWIDKANMQERT